MAFWPLSTSQRSVLRVLSAYCWAHPTAPPRPCVGSDVGSGVGSAVASGVGTNVVVCWILCSRTHINPGGMGQGRQLCPISVDPSSIGLQK